MPIQPKVFPLGPWTPDAPEMANDGVIEALNCLPSAHGYVPFREYSADTSALGARAQGAFVARDDNDAIVQYAGDATKLYENVGNVWTDKSKVGGYTTAVEDSWEFVLWKGNCYATNFGDHPQKIALGGAIFSDLTTDLKIKHWDVVRQFVVAGFTEDAVDGVVPWRVRWCGFNDPTSWTVSATTQADYEDLPQRKIQRVFGGEYGIIMQEHAIQRMNYVGSPVVFQFDNVLPDLGLIAPGAAARIGDRIYFLSERGFHVLVAGTQAQPIGDGVIDRYVLDDIDQTYLYRMSAVADPNGQRVFFGYPGSQSTAGSPNKVLCYDIVNNRWSRVEQDHEILWVGAGAATTLEQLDVPYPNIDTMDISFDSPRWLGGNEALAIFDTSHMSGFFDGSQRTATITTREYMFDGAQRVRLRGFRPLVEGDATSITARVRYRQQPDAEPAFSDVLTPNTGGRICCRTNARLHAIELSVGGNWEQAFGVMVESRDLGPGGRRG